MDNTEKEIDLINKQIYTTYIYLGTVILSILLLYNNRRVLKKEEPFFRRNTDNNLSVLNRSVILVTSAIYLLLNYKHISIGDVRQGALASENLQIEASWLTLIAGIIVLYATIQDASDYENPEL